MGAETSHTSRAERAARRERLRYEQAAGVVNVSASTRALVFLLVCAMCVDQSEVRLSGFINLTVSRKPSLPRVSTATAYLNR